MTRHILKPFWIFIALLFLLEAWLWDHIQPLVAKGAVVLGTILFLLAKGLGLMATLVLFEVCHEKLMELSWFRYAYRLVNDARAWAKLQVQPMLDEIAKMRARLLLRVKNVLGEGGFFEMLRRVRAAVKKRVVR